VYDQENSRGPGRGPSRGAILEEVIRLADNERDEFMAEGAGQPQIQPPRPRERRRRPRVSLVAALVVNVITMLVVALVILAVLLPGYRRSFTIGKAVRGADEVIVVVKTSEAAMRENQTDFLPAQDGLRNALLELVGSGGNVNAVVRDNYPSREWLEQNLSEKALDWLRSLYPAPEKKGGGDESGIGS
jgi:hypothetical protein